MAYPTVLYGPESLPYTTYDLNSPAPVDPGAGGAIAYLHAFPLGKQLVLEDGRKYRFASAGGSTLVIGDALTGPVNTSSQQNRSCAVAGVVGDRTITINTGASSALNTFAEGYLSVSVTPGAGQRYKIAGHPLMTTGDDLVYLAPGNGLRTVTVVTTTKYDLILNPYKGVKQVPTTTLTAPPLGVAITAPTTLQGCWIQPRGIAAVLTSDGTGNAYIPIAGTRAVVPSATAAGATQAETSVAGASKIQVTIGITHFAAADAAWSTIFLTIDG